ncbi:hypothetical Protein YC6258_01938 [Gynuella sunshinyii YC6258]|uniref:Uncharacterized protein n=1 Tax=Gynuella sunshinyii YC6258 TaxID=1445510 RepID=A0A0C5VH61_9GAMM|nr:hypothetical Protein YC6258_01938 [Gynuella sunshinyii YC6258]
MNMSHRKALPSYGHSESAFIPFLLALLTWQNLQADKVNLTSI